MRKLLIANIYNKSVKNQDLNDILMEVFGEIYSVGGFR